MQLSFLDDPFSTGRAVLESLRRLIDRGPVVIAIDDLQWLDSVTARALRYSLRRFRVEAVAVVATLRSDASTSDPLSGPTVLPPIVSSSSSRGPWVSRSSDVRSVAPSRRSPVRRSGGSTKHPAATRCSR
jgi:hypothetical protein